MTVTTEGVIALNERLHGPMAEVLSAIDGVMEAEPVEEAYVAIAYCALRHNISVLGRREIKSAAADARLRILGEWLDNRGNL